MCDNLRIYFQCHAYMYQTAVLIAVIMLYITSLVFLYCWKFVSFDQLSLIPYLHSPAPYLVTTNLISFSMKFSFVFRFHIYVKIIQHLSFFV